MACKINKILLYILRHNLGNSIINFSQKIETEHAKFRGRSQFNFEKKNHPMKGFPKVAIIFFSSHVM